MGIREAINENRPLAYSVIGVLLAGAAGFGMWLNGSGFPSDSTTFYFSDDDGKTFFADSVKQIPPFDHNGKTAHQAMVFRAGSNPPFVGYLQTYKPETASEIRKLVSAPLTGENGTRLNELRNNALVKRPGDEKWHTISSNEGSKATFIKPPAGQTGDLKAVEP